MSCMSCRTVMKNNTLKFPSVDVIILNAHCWYLTSKKNKWSYTGEFRQTKASHCFVQVFWKTWILLWPIKTTSINGSPLSHSDRIFLIRTKDCKSWYIFMDTASTISTPNSLIFALQRIVDKTLQRIFELLINVHIEIL